MGGIASSFISQNSSRKLIRLILLWAAVGLAGSLAVSTVMANILIRPIESLLDFKIENKPSIYPFPGKIVFTKARIDYKQKIMLKADNIVMSYRPWRFATLKVPVKVSGHGVTMRLAPEMAEFKEVFKNEDIDVDHFSADVLVDLLGNVEIESFLLDSKVIKFSLSPGRRAEENKEKFFADENPQ